MDARACRSTLMNSVFSSLLGLQIRSWALIKRLGINYIENYEGKNKNSNLCCKFHSKWKREGPFGY
jgi:hypothetical protein